MNELTRLADKYGSDKGSLKHNYTEHYYEYLEPLIGFEIHLLEIGVDKGASVNMWLDFMPNAFVTGIDLLPNPVKRGRYRHLEGDQTDGRFLRGELCYHRYDVIIDDGSHNYSDIFFTHGVLCNNFAKYYFIEDLGAKRAGNAMEDLKRFGFKQLAPQLAVKECV